MTQTEKAARQRQEAIRALRVFRKKNPALADVINRPLPKIQAFYETWREQPEQKTYERVHGIKFMSMKLHPEVINFSEAYAKRWIEEIIYTYWSMIKYLRSEKRRLTRERNQYRKKHAELLWLSLEKTELETKRHEDPRPDRQ